MIYSTYNTYGDLSDLPNFIQERVMTEYSVCGSVEGNYSCQETKTITTSISSIHIIVDLIKWEGDDVNYSTEASPQFNIKLEDIPQIIVCSNETMELRGIGCYRPGLSRLRKAVGHYYAICKRGNSWELFDDMKKHSTPMKSTTIVPCEYLVYTI
ncbi:uncharacterized protein LOC112680321 [Sipha flava]|uniref:Uncharacterized protein LOC112680321 n=1 Tax=Sipha flava TaxID=143950 RepID=A0A8B8F5R9_9HEMI|nr:uncharacterized protein LOC112680321 [Sipha flava]